VGETLAIFPRCLQVFVEPAAGEAVARQRRPVSQ
jgi:hypothetical protein